MTWVTILILLSCLWIVIRFVFASCCSQTWGGSETELKADSNSVIGWCENCQFPGNWFFIFGCTKPHWKCINKITQIHIISSCLEKNQDFVTMLESGKKWKDDSRIGSCNNTWIRIAYMDSTTELAWLLCFSCRFHSHKSKMYFLCTFLNKLQNLTLVCPRSAT